MDRHTDDKDRARVYIVRCPKGEKCSKKGGILAKRLSEQAAREALAHHLVASPYHYLHEAEAKDIADEASIESWLEWHEEKDADKETSVKIEEPPSEEPEQPREKHHEKKAHRRKRHDTHPDNSSTKLAHREAHGHEVHPVERSAGPGHEGNLVERSARRAHSEIRDHEVAPDKKRKKLDEGSETRREHGGGASSSRRLAVESARRSRAKLKDCCAALRRATIAADRAADLCFKAAKALQMSAECFEDGERAVEELLE